MRTFGHSPSRTVSHLYHFIEELTMKKPIPAVFLQKQLNSEEKPIEAAVKKPLVLDLYETEMRKIVGGMSPTLLNARSSLPGGGVHQSGGVTTFSGSEGWLDVAQADDCGL
jgi:hypothetical protein